MEPQNAEKKNSLLRPIWKTKRENEEYTIQTVSGNVLFTILVFCPYLKQFTSPWRFLDPFFVL